MTNSTVQPMRAIILYDSRTSGGSTDKLIDAIGNELAETGAYVEKAKCKATGDYSFLQDFDVVIMGAPVYYLLVSSQLLGALIQSNLKKHLKRKKIALFLTCGSPEAMATLLYLPQLKIHLVRNKILAEKIFSPQDVSSPDAIESFVDELDEAYKKDRKHRSASLSWSDEALELLEQIPSFFRSRIKTAAEEYAEEMGYTMITIDILEEAKADTGGL
ncbi:flavodoxin domain-containing protein [Chlorobium phaeobacteroides]|uniref:Proto-chlorophyllide reductase 57 kD subunit n=1 Tax=Chlorobium phaeobacteroides (strain DSM 266 / SMG 266 / 2430) TaxID=290317 RepID=A1BHL0_CHLPD|nr:flavodoxin domain-containing protein [Chlorobium phaeobacteroides]ABL65887.1 Proto-chlorophyllide reductase 57 kD subunit [Chlorobium phaeobacteroides DSM 266]